MKRIVISLVASFALPFALLAQEFSLGLDTSVTLSKMDVQDFTFYEKATPSFRLPVGSSAEFAGNGYIKGAYSSAGVTKAFGYGLDQLRLQLALKNPREGMGAFVFDMGRHDFADPSGDILSSPADGFSFSFKYPKVEVAFRAAYTGLLFLGQSSVSMSLADQARSAAGTEITGSPRVLVQADLVLPQVFGQAITLSVLGQNDLNPSSSLLDEGAINFASDKGGRLNTQYFELQSAGAFSSLGYEAFFAYGSGRTLSWLADASSSTGHSYSYRPISSFLTGLRATLPLTALPLDGATVALRVLVASGDKDATSATEGNISSVAKAFVPINSPGLGAVFSPSLSNIALCEASLSAAPAIATYRINGLVKLLSFFRTTAGPISASGIDSTSTSPYLGTEADLSLSCGILSDVAVSLLLGAFLPGTAFDPSYSSLQYYGNLTLTVKI